MKISETKRYKGNYMEVHQLYFSVIVIKFTL